MVHAPVDRGRSTVWSEDDVDIVHPQPALVAFPLQQDFARERHGVLCLRLSCTTSTCTKVATRKPPSPVLAIYATNYCGHPSGCAVSCTDEAVFTRRDVHNLHEWGTQNPHVIRHSSLQKILVSTFGLEL